ncbi:MAG: hypothetical protein WAV95_03275 [Azonexus sp.]
MANIDIALVAECGVLEQQAVLLCESIRQFAGKYADCPITVISPRPDRRPSIATLESLSRLGVNYLPLDIVSPVPEYGTTFRIYAAAEFERLSSAESILFLDSDLLFSDEPDLELDGRDALARPVDVKGMCTTGEGDPNDHYWQALCQICGVDYGLLPDVTTTVEHLRVKASYNGGFVLVRRSAGIFARTLDYFLRSVGADIAPFRGSGMTVRAGHGNVSERGSEFWGSSQACLSLAIWGSGLTVQIPDLSNNFPLHCFDRLSLDEQAIPLKAIHYHHLLEEGLESNPLLNGWTNVPEAFLTWLRNQVSSAPAVSDRLVRFGKDKTLVVVLGMHRSGTSAITRGLQSIGVELGDSLMPAIAGINDKGFFEDLDVSQFNIDLMARLGVDWDTLIFPPNALEDPWPLRDMHQRALELLSCKLQRYDVFGFKDPRVSRLLPFWQRVFVELGISVCYVLAYRHPKSVAHSLLLRDRMDQGKAYYLWLIHQLQSLNACLGQRCVVIDYDLLMDDPPLQLGRLTKGLGFSQADPDALEAYTEFLSPSLRHSCYPRNLIASEKGIPPEVVALNGILKRLSQDESSPDDELVTGEVMVLNQRLSDLMPALQLASRIEVTAKSLCRDLESSNAQALAQGRMLEQAIIERDLAGAALSAITLSSSWRVTRPLRLLKDFLKKAR